jgi:hypothetical protein
MGPTGPGQRALPIQPASRKGRTLKEKIMSQIDGLMELTDHEAETAAGGVNCRLAGVVYVDRDGDGSTDEVWLIYACG